MDTQEAQGTTWLLRLRTAIAGVALAGLAFGGVAAIGTSADAEPVEEAATWSYAMFVDDGPPRKGPVYGARATWS